MFLDRPSPDDPTFMPPTTSAWRRPWRSRPPRASDRRTPDGGDMKKERRERGNEPGRAAVVSSMTRWARGSTWPRTPLGEAGSSGGRPSDSPGPYPIGSVSWRKGGPAGSSLTGKYRGSGIDGRCEGEVHEDRPRRPPSRSRRSGGPRAPLPEVPYKQAVEALLTVAIPEHEREWVEDMARRGALVRPARAPGVPARSKPAPATMAGYWPTCRSIRSSPPSTRPSWTTGPSGSPPMRSG